MEKKTRYKRTDNIPKATIIRLSRYHLYLCDLLDRGVEKISSRELSKSMGITSSRLRQDLWYFGEFGQPGYGYRVEGLNKQIEEILGIEEKHTMVVVGAGNIGQSLVQYNGFRQRGFYIKGIFDINPKIIGLRVGDIPVQDLDELKTFAAHEEIDIGIITVPKDAAQSVADRLVDAGVKGIWNFASIGVEAPPEVIVENINLSSSLIVLSFLLKERRHRDQGSNSHGQPDSDVV